jgi:hypothetical protein
MASASDDPVTNEIQNNLGRLRAERLAALGEAAGVHVAMQSLLQHEARRIEGKLGPQHPRTQQLKVGLQSNGQRIGTLELERQLTGIDVSELPDQTALVHGRVVDEGDLGIDRLTVCLVDKSGAPAPDARESTSDAAGYFDIALEPESVDRLTKQHPEGIFLAVLTPRRRTVHQEPKPLALARGARLLLTIRLRGFGPPRGSQG